MKITDLKISVRLNLLLGITITFIFIVFGAIAIDKQQHSMEELTDQSMLEQINDLSNLFSLLSKSNSEKINIGSSYVEALLNKGGDIEIDEQRLIPFDAINQLTKESLYMQVPKWTTNGKVVQNSTHIVDAAIEEIGGTATIFQKIPEGYLRISTNVLDKNGNRAVGTYIPNSSPVSESINNGKAYYGKAFVVNKSYITSYKPLEQNGKIIGMIYYGIPEDSYGELKGIFANKVYFDSGYPYVVDKDGKFLIHPRDEGKSIADKDFFHKMVNHPEKTGHIDYEWEGRDKVQYFKYLDNIESYIAVTVYKNELNKASNKLKRIVIFSIVVSILLFIFINSFISKSITKGIHTSVRFAQEIAKGNLKTEIDIDQKDEVGQLTKALQNMKQRLEEMIREIITGANNLDTSSQQLSLSASEQAASTEEVSSSMEQMLANIMQNTENAHQTEKIASKSARKLLVGNESVNKTVSAMQNIAENITIIEEIAEKTDLLAINAAIEAARAGEHGKGFAVVALEVRKLAERSQKAAADINAESKGSVVVAQEAGSKMSEVVPEIEKTSTLVHEISAASREQNSGAEHINNAIQQLNTTNQNTAANAEELAAQAEQLKMAVSYFKIDLNYESKVPEKEDNSISHKAELKKK